MKRNVIDLEETTTTTDLELPESACWVAGIDIGPRHMGLCLIDGSRSGEDNYLPYMEHSSLYFSGEGYGYYKYNEGNCTEMVRRWIRDRWDTIFSKCEFVVIEKQMEGQEVPLYDSNGKRKPPKPRFHSRDCIMIEQNLKAMFDCYIPFGGPNYVCVGPSWWKNKMNIPYGVKDKNGKTHKNNKGSSVDVFKETFGEEVVQSLKKSQGSKVDDCIDAFWIAMAGYKNRDDLRKEYAIASHHNFKFGQDTINVQRKDRVFPWRRLDGKLPDPVMNILERELYLKRRIINQKIKTNNKKKSKSIHAKKKK